MMNIKRHPIPELITLDTLGHAILVYIRQSKRAKHISIRIRHEKIELIIPDSNFKKAQEFLLDKESWIRKKLQSRPELIVYNSDSLIIFGTDYPGQLHEIFR